MEFAQRFRGYLPVVVDFETGGFDHHRHPLLELACVYLNWQDDQIAIDDLEHWPIEPYEGSEIDPASLKVTGIDLQDPLREARPEQEVLSDFFRGVRSRIKATGCQRAILVAHNAAFDQGFLNQACQRCGIKRNPFHPFSALDTASLSALNYGHTVLAEACRRAGLTFDESLAHRADYDAERTASLFCKMVNASSFQLPRVSVN